MSDYFFRTPDPCLDRINDNIYFDAGHLVIEFDNLDLTSPCDKPGDPTAERSPDNPQIDRPSDRYPNLNRPWDNPEVVRIVDNNELEHR